jgi:glucose-1-phosphate thymidylyltransferase
VEITDVNLAYLRMNKLNAVPLGREFHWFDTGNAESMFRASDDIRRVQFETGTLVGCPEEIAYQMGYIDRQQLMKTADSMKMTNYGKYLLRLAEK